ncbi:hypothetical protein N9E11_04270 [Crocinitomicaceae bacterium]|nr:hypothetical protein [Crocinitomicaceae bacterium]MDB4606393.1 hypothetical protein [Crocinitomicaceae bacterium]
MKFTLLILAIGIQIITFNTIAQTPAPSLNLKVSKNLVFLDAENNEKPTIEFNSIFKNDGSKRDVTTWLISGREGKDWDFVDGNANAENIEIEFKTVGNYDVELAVSYTYDVVLKSGETEIEEDEVGFEQEAIVTAANNLDELTQIHADSNFLKLVKKADAYLVKPDYVNDPTPQIFLAKGYYGIYRKELKDPVVTDPYEETINSIAAAIELDRNGIFNQKIHKMWLNKFQNDFLDNYLLFNLEEEDGYFSIYNGTDKEKRTELLDLLIEGCENYAVITMQPTAIRLFEAPIRLAIKDARTANQIWKTEIENLKNMSESDFNKMTETDLKALKYGAMLSAVTLTELRQSNSEACELLTSLQEVFEYDRAFLGFMKTKYNNCKEE